MGITTYEEVLRVTHVDAVDPSSDKHCHTCTRQVDAEMSFCPWCTAPLTRRSCASCGERLASRWKGCPTCGTAVPAAPREVVSDQPDVQVSTPTFALPAQPYAPPPPASPPAPVDEVVESVRTAPPSSFLLAGGPRRSGDVSGSLG
jgi:RNA polymerase subunit RPABC4/transcription elongation factor Spt4